MKNDFDFIKDKIENSPFKAPEDMDVDYVLETIENAQPQPVVIGKKPKKRRHTAAIISAAAAGLVLVVALGVAVGMRFGQNEVKTVEMPGGLSLRQFQSYDEVKKAVSDLRAEKDKSSIMDGLSGVYDYFSGNYSSNTRDYAEYKSSDGDYAEDAEIAADGAYASGSSGSSSGSSAGGDPGYTAGDQAASHSETYKQVQGVDEGDIIKTDGKYIYCVDGAYYADEIVVFSAMGDRSRKVAEIDVTEALSTATPDESQYYYYSSKTKHINDIYLKDDRLIVVCDDTCGVKAKDLTVSMTRALVYDVSDIGNITLLDTVLQSGSCDSTRMIGDTLYMVSSYGVYGDCIIPACGRGNTPDEIAPDCIYAPEEPQDERFLVISAYDTLDYEAQTESKAIFGGVDDIYCNEDHMYIYMSDWDYGDSRWWEGNATVTTQIIKVDLMDGIALAAYGEVEGLVDDQYALDEYNGDLRIATTSSKNNIERNNLFVLDENLSEIGSVTGFAKNETIKAVRYIGETAYVITYEQTDPLFVIDLSKPEDPTILGEVKITGFSSMLVPIDRNTILGIGYHTQNEDYTWMEVEEGVKLALFDVSDKANPQVLDSKSYVDYYSPVQSDPKALVYNPERGDFVIPLNYVYYGTVDYDSYEEYMPDEERTGGMLNFKVEDGRIKEVNLYQEDYIETERCVYVGDYVYMTYHDDGTMKLGCVAYR